MSDRVNAVIGSLRDENRTCTIAEVDAKIMAAIVACQMDLDSKTNKKVVVDLINRVTILEERIANLEKDIE